MTGPEEKEVKDLLSIERDFHCGCGVQVRMSILKALDSGWVLSLPDKEFVDLNEVGIIACPACRIAN